MSTAQSSALKGRRLSLTTKVDLTTAICIPNHHLLGWFPLVLKVVSWECCAALLAQFRQQKRLRSFWGQGNTLSGRLLLYNALEMKFRELKLRPNPVRPVIEKLINYEEFCGIPQAKAAEEKRQREMSEITVNELKELLDSGADDFILLDARNPNEYEIARIPGSVLVPLPDIEDGAGIERVKELVNGHRLIAHCKMGGRSAKALSLLKEARNSFC